MKKIIFINLLALVAFLSGFYTCLILQPKPPTEIFSEFRPKNNQYQFINPLLECDDSAVSPDNSLNHLRIQIDKYINQSKSAGLISDTSIYYRDMNNGPWFGIKENEFFSPASLVKIPLLITYYKLADTDPSILQKVLTFNKSGSTIPQNILPEVTLTPNQNYTVSELLDQMIIYSDNDAYDLLFENIDNKLLINTYSDLGVDISRGFENPEGDIITVRSYASFFRIIFNASYLSKESSERLLQLLSKIKFKDGLVAGIPSKIMIAHKFGEREFIQNKIVQLHDCGIVYLPGKPYLICIMTRGKNFADLKTVIKNISSQIYTYVK